MTRKIPSKPETRILRGAREALALARGTADRSDYRIHETAKADRAKRRAMIRKA